MKSVSVLDMKGKTVEKLSLDETFFDGRINRALLHQAVLMYLANKRGGYASTKTQGEVRGGGRKPWRQKGTGRARVGSIRSPLWRGGGTTFGPHPRNFHYSLPKTIKHLALQQSLNDKVNNDEFIVVDKISLDKAKTKEFAAFLKAVKADDQPLVVIEKHNPQIFRACRNIPNVMVKAFNTICVLDVFQHKKVIFTRLALENLVKLRKE